MPVTPFSEVVCPRKNKLSLIFAKARLGRDWGPYDDFKVYINGVDPQTGLEATKFNDYPHIREMKLAMIAAEEAERQAANAGNQANGDQDFYDAA